MKKLIGLFIFAVIISVGMASYSYAANDMAAPSSQTVKGDLLKIDGEFYVLKKMSGKEIRLHVDKTSTLDGSINVGEKVLGPHLCQTCTQSMVECGMWKEPQTRSPMREQPVA